MTNTPTVIGFIFARGGSKGVPRKNIRPLHGKPLIGHAIDCALGSRFINDVIVSTDDMEIANVARQHGAQVPFMRPAELAGDAAPEWMAWQHAIREVQKVRKFDAFVSVPATSPLRISADVDACVELLLGSDADVVITVTESHRNPYFNMVVLDPSQSAKLVMEGISRIERRQDAPKVYDITTVAYAARPEFVLSKKSLFDGKLKAVVVPSERSLDIDHELDFKIAEVLMAEMQRQPAVEPARKIA